MNARRFSRREALRALGLTAVGASAYLCMSGCGLSQTRKPNDFAEPRRRQFARIQAARDQVLRTVVGLRPYRPSGFVVRAEHLGDKLLVHNYGHGGSGVTLSWGTAHLAADFVSQSSRTGAVAVLGCGAVGLATARMLQQRGFEVSIYANHLPPETTSNVSGAMWFPAGVVSEAHRTPAFDMQFVRAARLSHRHFQDLLGDEYGVYWREQYFLSDVPIVPQWSHALLHDLFPAARQLRPAEHPFPTRYVQVENTMFVEPRVYLDALLRDVRLAGGQVNVRTFSSPEQLSVLAEAVIVNCTGLGSRELFGDQELTPVKGQLTILRPQPDIDYAIATLDGHYMFARRDGIVLGGTYEYGVDTLDVNVEEEQRMLSICRRISDAMG